MTRNVKTAMVLGLVGCAALAVLLGLWGRARTDRQWRGQLAAVPIWKPTKESPMPMAVQDAMAQCGRILHAEQWTEVEVGALEVIAAKPVADGADAEEPTWADYGTLKYREMAMLTVAERIRARAPIEPGARTRAEAVLATGCESRHEAHRTIAAGCVMYARLHERPEFRRRLEAMRKDPAPMVAMVARTGLQAIDRGRDIGPITGRAKSVDDMPKRDDTQTVPRLPR